MVAERSGLDLARLFDALGGGYAGSRLLHVKGLRFVAHDHHAESAAKLMIKDPSFALQEAERTGTPADLIQPLHSLFCDLAGAGLGDLDSSVVQACVESRPVGSSG